MPMRRRNDSAITNEEEVVSLSQLRRQREDQVHAAAPCFGLLPHLSTPQHNASFWFHSQSSRNEPFLIIPDKDDNVVTDSPTSDFTPLYLLEIIGARGLPDETVDSYVKVSNGGTLVHRTDTVWNDANPIWTIETKSLCLLRLPEILEQSRNHTEDTSLSPQEASAKYNCIVFEVCHDTPFPKRLGSLRVPCQEFSNAAATGNRTQYNLKMAEGASTKATFAFRVRRATKDDVLFLEQSSKTSPKRPPHPSADINFQYVSPPRKMFGGGVQTDRNGTKRYEIKPYAEQSGQKQWMSAAEMNEAVQKPSTKWVTAGDFDSAVAVLHLEILEGRNLPVMDFVSSDAVGIVVVEDVAVRTDVIWDDLNPKWPHWSVRAFAVAVQSLESLVFLALFDYDETPLDDHDPIGRIVLKPTSFRPGLTYTLVYPLVGDHHKEDATIKLRLRVEWKIHDERSLLKAPPRSMINCRTLKAFRTISYTIYGPMDEPSMGSIKTLLNEILSYKQAFLFAMDVWLEVFLWRGQCRVARSIKLWFPIRSISLFLWVALLIEWPSQALPILMVGISSLFLCIFYHTSRHPLPWKRATHGVGRVLQKMIVGHSHESNHAREISANEGIAEASRLAKLDSLKAERMGAILLAVMAFGSKAYKIYSTGSVTITTDRKVNWNLFSGHLSPIHSLLQMICSMLRFFRSFLTWQGSLTAKTTTYTLLFATLWLVLPMNLLLKWYCRLWAWTFLGPLMKLLDSRYFRPWYETKDELLDRIDNGRSEEPPNVPPLDPVLQNETFCKFTENGRVVVEELCKLRDMRSFLFGSYSGKVPNFDNSRTQNIPLPESTAVLSHTTGDISDVACHLPGQRLYGNMIHSRGNRPPCSSSEER